VDVVDIEHVVLGLLLIIEVERWIVFVNEVALLEIVFLQHEVHHALVLELDCVNHAIELFLSLINRR